MKDASITRRRLLITRSGIIMLVLLALGTIGVLLSSSWVDQTERIVAVASTPQATPSIIAPTRAPSRPLVVREQDFGTWRYTVTHQPDAEVFRHFYAIIRSDNSSVSAIRAYATENRRLADQLAGDTGEAEIIVTFKSLIQPDVYRQWVVEKGIEVEVTSLRTLDTRGLRGSLGVWPEGSEVLPPHTLILTGRGLRYQPTIQGVYSLRGSVPTNHLRGIAQDSQVFLVDVTPTVVRRAIEGLEIQGRRVPTGAEFRLDVDNFYWNMEDLGLENFR